PDLPARRLGRGPSPPGLQRGKMIGAAVPMTIQALHWITAAYNYTHPSRRSAMWIRNTSVVESQAQKGLCTSRFRRPSFDVLAEPWCSRPFAIPVSLLETGFRVSEGMAMRSRVRQGPLSPIDGETVVAPANVGEPPKVCCPKRGIIGGSGPHLTKETQSLLRFRLRAAAFILLIGFTVFLVRHVVGVLVGEPLDPFLLGTHILVVLVLGFSSLPLCRKCPVSLQKL